MFAMFESDNADASLIDTIYENRVAVELFFPHHMILLLGMMQSLLNLLEIRDEDCNLTYHSQSEISVMVHYYLV